MSGRPFDDWIYAFIQIEDGTTYRQEYDRSHFTSIPRQGELFELLGPGGPLAVIERVVWRPHGGAALYMRPFGRHPVTAKVLETTGWFAGEDWFDLEQAPG